jgi:hypothetical protein
VCRDGRAGARSISADRRWDKGGGREKERGPGPSLCGRWGRWEEVALHWWFPLSPSAQDKRPDHRGRGSRGQTERGHTAEAEAERRGEGLEQRTEDRERRDRREREREVAWDLRNDGSKGLRLHRNQHIDLLSARGEGSGVKVESAEVEREWGLQPQLLVRRIGSGVVRREVEMELQALLREELSGCSSRGVEEMKTTLSHWDCLTWEGEGSWGESGGGVVRDVPKGEAET